MSNLHTFTPKTIALNKDMIELNKLVGGTAGEIRIGKDSVNAIKLEDNLYVTPDRVSRNLEKVLSIDNVDLHQIKTRSDIFVFSDRYKAYKHG